MTTIKASCPACGAVELTNAQVTLSVCGTSAGQHLSSYAFTCPECLAEVRKPADAHVVSLLRSGGVRAEVWELPAEALETKVGPPLTCDDLLDLATALAGTDLVAAVASMSAQASAWR